MKKKLAKIVFAILVLCAFSFNTSAQLITIGIEAVVALRRIGIEPNYLYGVAQAAIEAARSGLPFYVVCTGSEVPAVQQKLISENIKYTRIDARKR